MSTIRDPGQPSNARCFHRNRAGSPLKLGEALRQLKLPLDEARGLPPSAYVDENIFEDERTAVFHGWIGAAFEHQIEKPGDALPIEIAGVPVILLRSSEGDVRAYLNVCRHRGARVLSKPVRGRGTLTCRYHAWTYGQDGQLKRTPLLDGSTGFQPNDCRSRELALVPVRCAVWLGMIFLDLGGKAGPLEAHVAPLEPLWAPYQADRLKLFHYETGTVAGNWKLAVEAAVDTYHEGFVHRKLSHRVQEDGTKTFYEVGDGALFGLAWKGASSLRASTPLLPLRCGASESDRTDSLCFLFPNAQFNIFGGLSVRTVWVPNAVGQTEWRSSWYLLDEFASDEAHAEQRGVIIKDWREIREEDREVIELMHAGRLSSIAPPVQFVPFWEACAHRFQVLWAERMLQPEPPSQL